MKKQFAFGFTALLLLTLLGACNNQPVEESSVKKEESIIETSTPSSSKTKSSTSKDDGPKKEVTDISISLMNQDSKAYIQVRGKQVNYTADDFKWAWGLKGNDGTFVDGKAKPDAEDYQKVEFNSNNEFTVRYCLTDIQNMVSGVLYRIYGGTPETYDDIPFSSNQFGATDATRKYYLRNDENNSLVFDNIQPISFTKASVVNIEEGDLPTGITTPGAYLKMGGQNSKGITIDMIDSWNEAGKIAGNYQRVIPENNYALHTHVDEERFWKIEDNYVYFYIYAGFIDVNEGWMVHFDLVSGNEGANLQFDTVLAGETAYQVNGATYRTYADKNKGNEENYWGCLGVFREA